MKQITRLLSLISLAITLSYAETMSKDNADVTQVQLVDWQSIAATQSFKASSSKHHTLNYKMSWNGFLKAGECTLVFNAKDSDKPEFYTGKAWGRSTGIARGLYPYHFNYTAYLNKQTLLLTLSIVMNMKKEMKKLLI